MVVGWKPGMWTGFLCNFLFSREEPTKHDITLDDLLTVLAISPEFFETAHFAFVVLSCDSMFHGSWNSNNNEVSYARTMA